jgi:hypothetical protein
MSHIDENGFWYYEDTPENKEKYSKGDKEKNDGHIELNLGGKTSYTELVLNKCTIKDIHTLKGYNKELPEKIYLDLVVEMEKPSRHLCEQLTRYQFSLDRFKVTFRKDLI